MRRTALLLPILLFTAHANAAMKAIVYAGPGSCVEGCAEAVGALAAKAGIEVKMVTPSEIKPEIFKDAVLWIQPGGNAIEVARAVSTQQKAWIRAFVKNGGGYLGFCAGAFLADTKVDDASKIEGLHLIEATSYDYQSTKNSMILPVSWEGKTRYLYFEDGPAFKVIPENHIGVIAKYSDGAPAVVESAYGKGRVVLSGPHPEAPEIWKKQDNLQDPDGSDDDLGLELLQKALPKQQQAQTKKPSLKRKPAHLGK